MIGGLRQALLAAVAAWTAGLLLAATVLAHAELVDAVPAAGSTVTPPPAEIRLTFNETLLGGSQIVLYGERFQAVANVTTIVAGSQMRGLLAATLAPASYTVQWTAVSVDGHAVSGSYPFTVAAAAASAAPHNWTPLVAAFASIISGGMAVLIWILNRRSRL